MEAQRALGTGREPARSAPQSGLGGHQQRIGRPL